MKKNKKLYLVALYALDEGGYVSEVSTPEWVPETSEDRVKAKVLSDKLDEKLDWNVKIINTVNFR